MQIEVLASGSKANSYVLRGDHETLLLDAGLPIGELKRKLGFEMPDMCFLTHEHADHSKSIKDLIKLGVTCYMSEGTLAALGLWGHRGRVVKNKQQVETREFALKFFSTNHDCAEPLGALIVQKSTGKKVLFATDTYYIHYQFPQVGTMLIECNYAKDILDSNELNPTLRDRIVQSHFELDNLKMFIRSIDQSKLQNVVLLHLSDNNSDENRFVREVQEVTRARVQVANPGLKIQI